MKDVTSRKWKIAFFVLLGLNLSLFVFISIVLFSKSIKVSSVSFFTDDSKTVASANIPIDSTFKSTVIIPITSEQIHQHIVSHKANAYIIWYWKSWCAPCLHDMPDIIKLHDELKEKNVEVIILDADVNTGRQVKNSQRILALKHINFTTYIIDEPVPNHWWYDTANATSAGFQEMGDLAKNFIHFNKNLYSQFGVTFPNDSSAYSSLLIDDKYKVHPCNSPDDFKNELRKEGIH